MTNQNPNLSSRWYFHRYFRLTVLLAILAGEVVFLYLIRTSGWLETISLGNKIGVYAMVLSPLLIALPLIFRKQVQLSTVMIVVSLLAIFLGYFFRPVYFARNQKQAAILLNNAEIHFQTEAYLIADKENGPGFAKHVGIPPEFPAWVQLVMGKEYENIPYADEIAMIAIQNDDQIKTLSQIKLNNLKSLLLNPNISDEAILKHRHDILRLEPEFINFGFPPYSSVERDLSWLNNAECVTHLSVNNCENAPNMVKDLVLPNLKYIGLSNQSIQESAQWNKFFASPTVKNIEVLYLYGYATINDSETGNLRQLQNLKILSLTSAITDYTFLHDLKNLRTIEIQCPAINNDELETMTIPDWIQSAKIVVPFHLTEISKERFQLKNPKARVVSSKMAVAKYVNGTQKTK